MPAQKGAPDSTTTARKPGPKPLQSSSPRTQYLILYNFASALLWLVVLGRVLLLVPLVGFGRVYAGVGRFAKATQSLALLEVVHAASGKCSLFLSLLLSCLPALAGSTWFSCMTGKWFMCVRACGKHWPISLHFPHLGLVRAPISTTGMQVASRLLLVWGVVDRFPFLAHSAAYSSMLVAWSVTEVIRYSYFVLNLSGYQPALVTWFRYNTFYVLYPLGISSECWLIYKAVEPAREVRREYAWALQLILLIYIPGM